MITNAALERVSDHQILSTRRTMALIHRARAGDKSAEDKLVRCNTRLLKDVLRSFVFDPQMLDDLVVVGQLAIKDAIRDYRPELNTTWATFVYGVAWRKMATLLDVHRRATDVSPRARQQLAYLTPDDDSPDRDLLKTCDRLRIRHHMRILDCRERYVISSCFGLDGDEQEIQQIAAELGISRQRASQLRVRALGKLHASISASTTQPAST